MWKKSSAINDGKTVSNFECGICGDLPTNVHQTDCGHIFCYTCIKVSDDDVKEFNFVESSFS